MLAILNLLLMDKKAAHFLFVESGCNISLSESGLTSLHNCLINVDELEEEDIQDFS